MWLNERASYQMILHKLHFPKQQQTLKYIIVPRHDTFYMKWVRNDFHLYNAYRWIMHIIHKYC